MFYIELKRVLNVEKEILNDSQSFLLPKKERNFSIENFFDWNEMNIEDLIQINEINLKDLYEKWKKNICEKRPCYHQEKIKENKDPTPSSCDCNSELNLDMILHRQPIDEIELNEETCSRLSPVGQIENHDKINDCLTTETLTENEPDKNSRISLFKQDKSISTHSLSPILRKSSDIFNDFF